MNDNKLEENINLPDINRPAQETPIQILGTGLSFFMPIAAFFPVLAGCAANVQHQHKMNNCVKKIEEILSEHAEKINYLTENQYKLILESIASVMNTVNENKLMLLQNIIETTITTPPEAFPKEQIDPVARTIRDISFEEAVFFTNLKDNARIRVFDDKQPDYVIKEYPERTVKMATDDPESPHVFNLIGLGLLGEIGHSMDSAYEITPFGKKVRSFSSLSDFTVF